MVTLRSKTAMQLAALGLLVFTCWILVWAFTATISIPAPSAASTGTVVPSLRVAAGPAAEDVASRWDRLFARRFQGPLFDPPAEPPPVVVATVVPPPPIQLIATMPEPSGGNAMIQDDKGNVSVLPLGAIITAGGTTATLLKVYDDRVELQHEGKVITVNLKID
ncbi:MAG: hypothetical protein ACYC3X_27600 [Pirellulaceae bacterium]